MSVERTNITSHQARYLAESLFVRAGGLDAVGSALFDARVDLNPHQIEAALVGVQATADRGRLLADEVGLGKTIEAALVLCQRWAERRRRLLVIAPAALRRQWAAELQEKFGMPTRLLDGRDTVPNPFDVPAVAICSYQFASARSGLLAAIGWDLVVIDEAHRLRNAWRGENRLGRPILSALRRAPKLLLTATPLQNSLMELYGVVSIIDDKAFGDPLSFRARYEKRPDFGELRARLADSCHRTLRRDVLPYVRYTARQPLTFKFRSSVQERELYEAVSDLLDRDDITCLPERQRELLRMLLRKLLASSSRAIAGALSTLRGRLQAQAETTAAVAVVSLLEGLAEEGEPLPVEIEEVDEEALDQEAKEADSSANPTVPRMALREEIVLLDALVRRAESIGTDQRAVALLGALKQGFIELRKLRAPEKAVVFTESRRTQAWLADFLEENGYSGNVVCFNGSNSDSPARAALRAWEARNPVTATEGSRSVNMRAALVDRFAREGTIFLTTEAGAEGLNLQFCAMVVNYDLPWNPQRVEQRIGRCHRYGQRFDVVVVNFLDRMNEADRRVLELLTDKCHLFEGVFGASDAVLGAVEGGFGLERKIHRIYRTCRRPEQIAAAFDSLRAELGDQVKEREKKAREALFEHFDADGRRSALDRRTPHPCWWRMTKWNSSPPIRNDCRW